jgi:hypothetical protein
MPASVEIRDRNFERNVQIGYTFGLTRCLGTDLSSDRCRILMLGSNAGLEKVDVLRPINPALPGRKPSPTTMPPFFGLLRKAVFYSKNCTKLQENHKVFNEYSRQNADAIAQSRARTNHLLEKSRLLNCRSTRQLEEENSRQTNSA